MQAWKTSSSSLNVISLPGYLVDEETGRLKGIVVAYGTYDAEPRRSEVDTGFGFFAALFGFEPRSYVVVIPTDPIGSPAWPYRLQPTARSANGIWAEIPHKQIEAAQRQQLRLTSDVPHTDLQGHSVRVLSRFSDLDLAGDFIPRPWWLSLENCSIVYWKDENGVPRPSKGSLAAAIASPATRYLLVPRSLPGPAEDGHKTMARALRATPLLLVADVVYTPMILVVDAMNCSSRWLDEIQHPERSWHDQ